MILPKEIIREWNLEKMSPLKQKEAVERIGRILYQAILVKSLDILSDTQQAELDSLLNQDRTTPDQVLKFLKTKIPNFDSVLIEARQALKEDLVVQSI